MFRPARPASVVWNVVKTIGFVLVVWSVLLFVIPIGISILEVRLGIQRFPPQATIAMILLLAGTALAGWSALVLAVAGRGTPAAFDGPRQLVVAGPYRFVRHPFALATLLQMAGITLAFGSVPVAMYALLLFAGWYGVVRPHEERDLDERFGRDWRRYAGAVRALRPRLTPYLADRTPAAAKSSARESAGAR